MADTENKRWRVEMADKTTRVVEARGFRVEHGALVLVHFEVDSARHPRDARGKQEGVPVKTGR